MIESEFNQQADGALTRIEIGIDRNGGDAEYNCSCSDQEANRSHSLHHCVRA